MAAPQRIAPEDAELVTFAQARKILGGITQATLLDLFASGHLRPHPVLADRINKNHVEEFAKLGTDPNEGTGRTLSTPSAEVHLQGPWGVPKMR